MRLLLILAICFLLFQLVRRVLRSSGNEGNRPEQFASQDRQEEFSSHSSKGNPDLDYSTIKEAKYRDRNKEEN